MVARILNRQACFVRELAEVHLPGVGRIAEHHDVRAGRENSLFERRDDDGVNFGMLESNPLNQVRELDVDAEIVRVQLQAVVGREAGVLADVHRQRRHGAVYRELPVMISIRMGLEGDW